MLIASIIDAVCTIIMTVLLGFVATLVAILIVEQMKKRRGKR